MASILYLQMNLVGMVILGIILFNQRDVGDGTGRQKAFCYLSCSLFAMLVVDAAMWWINGKQFPFAIQINWIVSSIYYFFNCFNVFIWFLYLSTFFIKKKIQNKNFFFFMSIPTILNTIFILLNVKYPIYFYISEGNTYVRAPLFLLSAFVVLPYLLMLFYNCLKLYHTTENLMEKKDCLLIIRIHLLPVIGAIIQILFYGLSLIWMSAVLSLLFMFINFQNKRISTDPLTQLNNRYQFDICLQNIQRDMARDEFYSILFIDIDKFKEIHDRYGHIFGDNALVSVAKILRRACDKEGAMIGRYGGDEFYVFCKLSAKEKIIKRIYQYVAEYNAVDILGVGLSLSVGSSDFGGKERKRTDDIVAMADKAMYKNKGR